MKIKILGLIILSFLLITCKKNELVDQPGKTEKSAPDAFNFSTTREVKINIRLTTNMNEPIKGVPVTLNTPDGAQELLKMVSDKKGYITTTLQIATYLKELTVKTPYIGLINKVNVSISSNSLDLTLGGPKGLSGDIIKSNITPSSSLLFFNKTGNQTPSIFNTNYEYMGTYQGNGTPDYLMAPGNVSAGLLSYINASLPNNVDLRVAHPEYLSSLAIRNLNVVERGEVFITFVAEGAGYLNSLGYYTYPTGFPPTTKQDISTVKYIFPNASDGSSGGGLSAGSKVSLGMFDPGTTIAFVLLSDSWDGGAKVVKSGNTKFYSDDAYNSESDANLKIHSVLLNYGAESSYVIGFEDTDRSNGSNSDHDFNDLVLYASANPLTALSPRGVKPLDDPKDCDNDGVTDEYDEFPCDGDRAYTTSYPSKYGWGTLAFEDSWPNKGDYDFNDLVLKFRYTSVSNANNQNIELQAKFTGTSALAQFKNGFGISIPTLNPAFVTKVTGARYSEGYVNLSPNGTEAGQGAANTVIIPFDNNKLLIDGNNIGLDTLRMTISFAPTLVGNISSVFPFNPFLISNGKRGYEVHLAGNSPTLLASTALFGTGDTNSISPYKDTNNMPWALLFNEEFKYPKEGVNISTAYLHFGDWATSSGGSFTDWYNNVTSGYRNTSLIHN
ncbi:MAG: LruC domain-containing protein [Pelobium sp.]